MAEVSTYSQEEARQWAVALLEAAGPTRKLEVRTEKHPGEYIRFVVPDDIFDAAVKAGAGPAAEDKVVKKPDAVKVEDPKVGAAKKGAERTPPPDAAAGSGTAGKAGDASSAGKDG